MGSEMCIRDRSCAVLSSSIFATRFLNSSYWHFSYECLSFCRGHCQCVIKPGYNIRVCRTSHFQGRYNSSYRQRLRGMRRCAHESR